MRMCITTAIENATNATRCFESIKLALNKRYHLACVIESCYGLENCSREIATYEIGMRSQG